MKFKKIVKEARKPMNKSQWWHDIPGAKYIYHGDWSDPEVTYKGFSFSLYDVEEGFLDEYRGEHPEDKNDRGFDDWFDTLGGPNGAIASELDDLCYAALGDNGVEDKEWLGIPDAFKVKEVYGQEDGEYVLYKDCLVDISDFDYYDEDQDDYFTYDNDPQGFEAYYIDKANRGELIDQLNRSVRGMTDEQIDESWLGDKMAAAGKWFGQKTGDAVTGAAKMTGKAAAATGKAVGKAAVATGKVAGKAAAATGKALGKAAVATGKAAGKAASATGKAVGKAAVATGKAAGKAAVTTGKVAGKAALATGKAAGKAALKGGKVVGKAAGKAAVATGKAAGKAAVATGKAAGKAIKRGTSKLYDKFVNGNNTGVLKKGEDVVIQNQAGKKVVGVVLGFDKTDGIYGVQVADEAEGSKNNNNNNNNNKQANNEKMAAESCIRFPYVRSVVVNMRIVESVQKGYRPFRRGDTINICNGKGELFIGNIIRCNESNTVCSVRLERASMKKGTWQKIY